MNRQNKKHSSTAPENWDEFKAETLLFATEVCMMDRDTKVIRVGDNGGYGALAGVVFGIVIIIMQLGIFQLIDNIQRPNLITYTDFSPWKSNRIKPITAINIGPPTPPKPAVVATPVKPPAPSTPAPKPKQVEETAKVETVAKVEVAAKAEAEAKAEAAAKAEAEAKAEAAAKAAAKAEAEAKAEAAAKAETEAKAEAAAKAEAEAKAEAATKAEAEAKAETAAKAEAEAKAEAAAKAEVAAKAEAEAKAEAAISAAEDHETNILNTVTNWAKAWSNQKIDTYIGSYTSDFKPQQYKSHEYWANQRRKRLSRPSSINIQLSNVQVSLTEDGNAAVTFVQIYKSPSFTDQVRKTLVLEQESGRWRISSETAKQL